MYCTNCGMEFQENSKFCFRCGEKIIVHPDNNSDSDSPKSGDAHERAKFLSADISEINEDGIRFIGQTRDGKRHGFGIQIDSEGSLCVGEFIDDKQTGYCAYKLANGDKSAGCFVDSTANGFCIV
jgi:hypothetical protein